MRKYSIAFLMSVFLLILIVNVVIAGATFDLGTLAANPPKANWTAWLKSDIDSGTGIPSPILTEDNTNNSAGEDQGYIDIGGGNYYWLIQVENLPNATNGSEVDMIFGTLDEYAGDLYTFSFSWNKSTDPSDDPTFHPELQISGQGSCPTHYVSQNTEGSNNITFYGIPDKIYHLYRSQNPSDALNGASNGRYYYLTSVTTDGAGVGTYIDTPSLESWYVIVKAGEGDLALEGCHSELGDPTGVRVFDFDAVYNPDTQAVDLSWKKSDPSIIGFNVFRGTDENIGNAVKINADQIDSIDEETFTYEDTDIVMGETYFYWIELVDNNARIEKVGPRTIVPGFKIFMPIISD